MMRVEPVGIGHLEFVRLVWTQLLGKGREGICEEEKEGSDMLLGLPRDIEQVPFMHRSTLVTLVLGQFVFCSAYKVGLLTNFPFCDLKRSAQLAHFRFCDFKR